MVFQFFKTIFNSRISVAQEVSRASILHIDALLWSFMSLWSPHAVNVILY